MRKPSPPLLFAAGLALSATCALAAPKMSARAEAIGFWRFEHDVKTETNHPALAAVKRLSNAEFFFSEAVPGRFIYDPLQKISYPNSSSLNFNSDDGRNDALEILLDAVKAGLVNQSVTLELFFKPAGEWAAPLAMKSRLDATAAEWGLEAISFPQFNQTYLHAFFTGPGSKTEHFRGGHYGTSAQIHARNLDWRHMALVCDATEKTLTCYIDYYQAKTIPMPGEMKWDAGPLYIGGGAARSCFCGSIDEVRLTKGALQPAQFLRARQEALAGATFESVETVLPRASGYVDLKEAFGAVGDGKTDDTAALREAFRVLPNRMPLAHHTLYIPPGTYLVSDTLQSSRFFTVQGAGVDKTIIKLRDQSPGFTQPGDARPVWRASSTDGPPGSNQEVNGSSIANSIYDLTIETGKGNAGAKALEYHSNNVGRLENVLLRSGDGSGVAGLDLTHKSNGPALIKNVQIEGFDFGVLSAWQEYSMTMEHVTLEGQRVAGIKNNGNILAIRKLQSVNKVPALISEGANSMITLLDSTLKGTGRDTAAIVCDGGLYVLRVETPGYKTAIRKRTLVDAKARDWKEETIAGPKISEFIADKIVTGHGTPTGALKLPIEDTPQVPWGSIQKDWVSVKTFEDRKQDDDWSPAIQAAIDSGAKTIYFPQGRYDVASPLHLRGKIERLFGLHSRIARRDSLPTDQPVVIFDEPDASRVVSIERLEIDSLQHASPATLVLKSASPSRYTNAPGSGKLFMEDICSADFRFENPQSVWVRQWNPESHAAGPCILSRGATIWCLGFKTEFESSKLWAEAGAQTEILGAFIYPIGEIPADRPIFKNTDSKMALVYGTSVYRANHRIHIIDTLGNDVRTIGNDELLKAGSRERLDLYTSDSANPPPAN